MSGHFALRRPQLILGLLLGLGLAGCSPGGSISGPSGTPGTGGTGTGSPGGTGIEGTVYLTHDLPSEGVQVLAIWLEQEGASSPGGGIDAQVMSVPVASGAMPVGAQVQSARTDASGRFSHPRSIEGGVTLRLGALPSNCRRPADRVVAVVAGAVQRVQLDVLCYGPKTPAAPIE